LSIDVIWLDDIFEENRFISNSKMTSFKTIQKLQEIFNNFEMSHKKERKKEKTCNKRGKNICIFFNGIINEIY
jgi:hypothetical protein